MLSRLASCFSFIWRSRLEHVVIIVACRGLGAGRDGGEKCHVVNESEKGGLYQCHVVNVFEVFEVVFDCLIVYQLDTALNAVPGLW